MSPEQPADDPLFTATQLVLLAIYCVVLYSLVTEEPTGLSRTWARAKPRLSAAWSRVTLPLRWRREAPYVVWEAMTIVGQP